MINAKRSKVAAALLALAGMGATTSAHAQGWYLGGSVGQANIEAKDNLDFDGDVQRFELDSDDTGFKVFGGYQFLDWLALEVAYVDLGAPDDGFGFTIPGGDAPDIDVLGDIEAEVTGFTAELVASVPIGPVSVFAKAGGVMWDADLKVSGSATDGITTETFSESIGDDGEDFTYGAGASVAFGSLSVRAEYQIFDIDGVDDVNMISIGLVYTPGAR